ncbi:uncharacterized protein FIBRA_08362 [Fibroporia radiculosa]|uniref:Bulb-type lectin domain-containing protein n=1 Tax=Fibroporia radiculosa TaxID=599839 RepID=J4GH71_9APHY|nr:uncharacterized protein FIBRA_08362 [Fibroporia radiculosa]CCM06113.1 predicted protein [Fibroporia radiculosa]
MSGSSDKAIRVWDANTRQQLGEPLEGHTGSVRSVAVSPDGQRIVSGSSDKTVRVWDADMGRQLGESFKGHTSSVRSVAISHNGQRIVSCSDDRTIRVWDAEMGQEWCRPLQADMLRVNSLAISYDGRRIVFSVSDNTIRVWDAVTMQQLGEPLAGHTDVVVWDADAGRQLGGPLEGHTSSIISVAISYEGLRIVSGSHDKTIRVWGKTIAVRTSLESEVTPSELPISIVVDASRSNILPSTGASALNLKSYVSSNSHIRGHFLHKVVEWTRRQIARLVPRGRKLAHSRFRWQTLSEDMACTCNFNNPDQNTNIDTVALYNRPLCYLSNLGHALNFPASFWGDAPPSVIMPDQDGWIIGPNGQLLLWVPIQLMEQPLIYASGNALVIPDGALQLDLSQFTHGEAWYKCYDPDAV